MLANELKEKVMERELGLEILLRENLSASLT